MVFHQTFILLSVHIIFVSRALLYLYVFLINSWVCASHPVWYSRVHSYGLFTLLFNHQVHVVVLQDGDHLHLHGTLKTHAQHSARHFRRSLMSHHYSSTSAPVFISSLLLLNIKLADKSMELHTWVSSALKPPPALLMCHEAWTFPAVWS